MLKEAYSMSTLPVTAEQIPAISDIQSSMDESALQREAVKYEHSGYQIRVHFGGDKTFLQCIRNLADRRISS